MLLLRPLYKEGDGGGEVDGESGGLRLGSADEKFSNCHETRLLDSMANGFRVELLAIFDFR